MPTVSYEIKCNTHMIIAAVEEAMITMPTISRRKRKRRLRTTRDFSVPFDFSKATDLVLIMG
jgi:hypothetical protein